MDDLLPVICKIVNLSLESCYMPPTFKKAVLSPTLKKSALDYQEFANFRPISNLEMVSKLIEKVVSSRLIGYLDENNLQELFQLHINGTTVVKLLYLEYRMIFYMLWIVTTV